MTFMIPDYESHHHPDAECPWWEVETNCGTELVPAGLVSRLAMESPDDCTPFRDYIEGDPIGVEPEPVTGYFARLSAPGYLDATEWAGPFETLAEAREYIADTYDVDPDTGAELDGPAGPR